MSLVSEGAEFESSVQECAEPMCIGPKRSTPQNLVIGGAAGALPPLVGWVAVTGSIAIEPCLLFLIIFFWTPPHFWALSLNHVEDYARARLPMLPIVAGSTETQRQ